MNEQTPERPAAAGLRIDREADNGGVALILSGELDLASAPYFEQALEEARSAQPTRLLIDLRNLVFMDSTGLRALLLARQHASSGDHQLVLRRGPHQVQRVFELTGTLDTFTFED
jgi:anti-anti-sigma factor